MSQLSTQVKAAMAEYRPRATKYDTANAGWHADLADDFITWARPCPGEAILDLACGTGPVTFRMAQRVGHDGIVIGIDVTPAMLDVAGTRSSRGNEPDSAEPTFITADITSPALANLAAVIDVVAARGGFDVISCCSALILLPDPPAAIALWTSLLRADGRLIVHVPTEDPTVQYLASVEMPRAMGITPVFNRGWVRGQETLERCIKDCGLEVAAGSKTRSYLPVRRFGVGEEDARKVWEEVKGRGYVKGEEGRSVWGTIEGRGGEREEGRFVWERVWREVVAGDGGVVDGHWLYVCVGMKRVEGGS